MSAQRPIYGKVWLCETLKFTVQRVCLKDHLLLGPSSSLPFSNFWRKRDIPECVSCTELKKGVPHIEWRDVLNHTMGMLINYKEVDLNYGDGHCIVISLNSLQ